MVGDFLLKQKGGLGQYASGSELADAVSELYPIDASFYSLEGDRLPRKLHPLSSDWRKEVSSFVTDALRWSETTAEIDDFSVDSELKKSLLHCFNEPKLFGVELSALAVDREVAATLERALFETFAPGDSSELGTAELLKKISILQDRVAELEQIEANNGILLDEKFAPELSHAMALYQSATKQGLAGSGTVAQRLRTLAERLFPNLKQNAIKRIVTVCNWDKEVGRKS